MAGRDLAATGSVLTADGGADGSLTMASTAAFRVGSKGFVSSNNVTGVEVVVTEITSPTVLKVRLTTRVPPAVGQSNLALNPISYGSGSTMAAYTLAQSARFDCPQQFIYNEP